MRGKLGSGGRGKIHGPIPILQVEITTPPRSLRAEAKLALILFSAKGMPVGQLYVIPEPDGAIPLDAIADRCRHIAKSLKLPVMASDARTASVVICTRDRPDELRRCLASFAEQRRKPDQIVVVDNASRDDRTRAVALAAGVDYVREDRPGLDIARNTGALHATGDIVAYTDDDTVLHEQWLARLVAAFDEEDIMAVTGLVLPAELETHAQQMFEWNWGFGRGFDRIEFDRAFFERTTRLGCPVWWIGAGANMAFRGKVFTEVGLFDERLDVGAAGCSGDSEYWYRILAAGWRCRYEPTAVLFHYHRRSFDALAGQIYHYMRGHLAALLVQYERTGHIGNLRRAFLTLPILYARRAMGRIIHGKRDYNCLIGSEIRGAIAGVYFYLRTPRPAGRRPR